MTSDGPHRYKHGWIPIAGTPSHTSRSADIIAARAHATEAMHRGGLPQDMHGPMLKALSHQEKYPGLIQHLKTIDPHTRPNEGGAYEHQTMHVAPDLFKPGGFYVTKRAERQANADALGLNPHFARIQAVNNGHVSLADALIAHESGHAVERIIGNKGMLDSFTSMAHDAKLPEPVPVVKEYWDGSTDIDLEATVKKWFGQKQVKAFVARNLSVYGSNNASEAAGEMWSVYSLDGANSPSWVRAFGDTATAILARKAGVTPAPPETRPSHQSQDIVDFFKGAFE